MSIDFTGAGQGVTTPTTPISGFHEMLGAKGITPQTASPVGGGASDVFSVPVGPKQIIKTDTFVNPDAPYISKYWAAGQEIFPTMTNVQIKQKLLELNANDPEAYKDFLKDMERSGYDSVDDMLYGAVLAQKDVNEFLKERVDSGLFGGGGSGGPTTTVTTNESNRGQAYQTANPQFEQGLGRQITADELTEFRDMLNKFERDNPYITNSGRGYSKTTGGFNPAELSKSFVQGQEDYAESQVAMNFMGVLDKILKNPDDLGETLQERMN